MGVGCYPIPQENMTISVDYCLGLFTGGDWSQIWDTAVKYDMKSFETLWWWSQNCQNWIFELGKNLFTPWKQRSLIETPKHKPNRNKAPTWQGFLSTPRHQIHAHTKSSPPNSSLIFFQHDLPSRWAKTFAFPYLLRMPPLSRHHFVCFGAPNPLMHLRCKTHMVKESLKVSWNLLWLPETQASPFLVGSLWHPNNLGFLQPKKKHPLHAFLGVFLGWRQICMVQFNFLGILAISLAHGQTSTWRLAKTTGRPGHWMKKRRLQLGEKTTGFWRYCVFCKDEIGKMEFCVYLGWIALQDF